MLRFFSGNLTVDVLLTDNFTNSNYILNAVERFKDVANLEDLKNAEAHVKIFEIPFCIIILRHILKNMKAKSSSQMVHF